MRLKPILFPVTLISSWSGNKGHHGWRLFVAQTQRLFNMYCFFDFSNFLDTDAALAYYLKANINYECKLVQNSPRLCLEVLHRKPNQKYYNEASESLVSLVLDLMRHQFRADFGPKPADTSPPLATGDFVARLHSCSSSSFDLPYNLIPLAGSPYDLSLISPQKGFMTATVTSGSSGPDEL